MTIAIFKKHRHGTFRSPTPIPHSWTSTSPRGNTDLHPGVFDQMSLGVNVGRLDMPKCSILPQFNVWPAASLLPAVNQYLESTGDNLGTLAWGARAWFR